MRVAISHQTPVDFTIRLLTTNRGIYRIRCVCRFPPNECIRNIMRIYIYYNLLDAPKYILHISRSFADVITRAHIRKPIIIIPFLRWPNIHLRARQMRFRHANLPSVIFHPLVQFPITKSLGVVAAYINQRDTSR